MGTKKNKTTRIIFYFVNRDFIERELRFAMFIENVLAIIINTSLFLIIKSLSTEIEIAL